MKHLKRFENFYLQPDIEEVNTDSEAEDLKSLFSGKNTDDDGIESEIDYTSIPGEPDSKLRDVVVGRMPEDELATIGHDEEEGDLRSVDNYDSSEEEEGDAPSFSEDGRHIMSFEAKNNSYKKSGLKNPKKADLNKDKKISGYEKKRGKAIEDSMDKKDKGLTAAQKKLPEGLRKAIEAKKK